MSGPPLPPFNYHGFLPEGIHDCAMDELRKRIATNPQREFLWSRLTAFLDWARSTGRFSFAYIDGGFITSKA